MYNNDSWHDSLDPGHTENQHHFTPGNAENPESAEKYRSNGRNQNEDANDALENDPFYKLTIDKAVDTYQTTPHSEHHINTSLYQALAGTINALPTKLVVLVR